MNNIIKSSAINLILLIATVPLFAATPNGYYNSAEGKTEAALKTALHYIIDDHEDNGYGGLYYIYEDSDDKSGKVWDMYSNCTWYHGSKKCGNYSNVCDCYNREHIVPQSWFDEDYPMRSDAFHVVPTDGKINGLRGSYPHGETNGNKVPGNGLGKIGTSSVSGYTGTVYEPDDQYKGDIARSYFYFVTRYQNKMTTFSTGGALAKNTYPSLAYWFQNLMLKWHREDPVSQKERDRQEGVYKHQRNRNPFIDHPALVEFIWGNKKGQAWYASYTSTEEISENKLLIKENPVKSQLIIEGNSTLSFQYNIYSISGKLELNGNSSIGEEINVSSLTNGVYIFKINSEGKNTTLKFIVTK